MTREEAINKVRQMSLPKETMDILEALAPELAESEDERIRMALCDIVRDMPYMETELRAHGLTVEKTLAYLEKQKEQKPTEWSEEDEERISEIEFAVMQMNTKRDDTKNKCLDWLKSLRSQPRAKTNDYITPHKKFFKWIYNRLIDVHGENPNVDYMQSFKKRIDNLQFDEPRWKPSEEQMKALHAASSVSSLGEYVQRHLFSLYNDLKKLM